MNVDTYMLDVFPRRADGLGRATHWNSYIKDSWMND